MKNSSYHLKFLSVIFCIVIGTASFSQTPGTDWDKTIGGSLDEILTSSDNTSDGGMILCGGSMSNSSGDKTENSNGGYDFWFIKLDADGNIEWQNAIGGNGSDVANSVQQTLDGGYIAAGYSDSGISGDKTEASQGSYDVWVVRLDSAGNLLWQNTIGGNDTDMGKCIRETSDLGFIIAAQTTSGATGDKSEGNKGAASTSDYWVIKLDNNGNLVWENTIGGNNYDYLFAVEQTWDGGYIIGGYSQSGISPDKTEALIGASDYWVLKLNAAGNIQWQNTIGGTGSESIRRILLTNDGGYLLAGFSTSDISGDKTEIAYGTGSDYWIVKISNTGSIQWQNNIGGLQDDLLLYADNANDGGFILGGVSFSGASGDKTEASMGEADQWIIKTDASGNIEWQNTIGGSSYDEASTVIQHADGSFHAGGYSKSGISGDKTEANKGAASTYDYWIVKILSECVPLAEICNTFDDDCNGLIDDGITETISVTAAGATTFCQGGSVVLNATHTGTSLQWKRNGNNIAGATAASYTAAQKGVYTCETTSACGIALSTGVNVIVNKNPAASITPGGPLTFCAGGSVTLTVTPVGGSNYQWYKNGSPIAGETATSYVATTTGSYRCRVTKIATGCYKNSNPIAVSVPCRQDEFITDHEVVEHSLTIYPNPNKGHFTMNASGIKSQEIKIEIFNSLGEIVFGKEFASPGNMLNETIDMGDVPAGIYVIRLSDSSSFIEQKLMLE